LLYSCVIITLVINFICCIHCLYIGPPIISFITKKIVAFEGNKVILICNATNDVDAITSLRINWYNTKGAQVKSENKHKLIYSTTDSVTGQIQSVLLFDPVNHTDSGEYICRAFNDDDCYTEDKTNLTVECKNIVDMYALIYVHCYAILTKLKFKSLES